MSSHTKVRIRPRYEAKKHTNLCTIQRRLRHLTSIIGRNIDANLVPSRRQTPKCLLLSLYFTIHAEDNPNTILYTSEMIDNTLNPNWSEFDSTVFSEHPSYIKASSVIICVWGARKSNTFVPIFRYHVHFSGLQYSKEQLRSNEQCYDPNSLLFGMFGGFYVAPSSNTNLVDIADDVILAKTIPVKENNVHLSYKKSSLLRANNSMKAIYETRQQVIQVKNQMEHLLSQNEHRKQKCAQREALQFRNRLLRLEWEKLQEKLFIEKQSSQKEQEDILHRKEEINRRREDLEQYICEMKISHSSHMGRREMLLKVLSHLNFRQRQLAAELSYIYPIMEQPMKDDNKKEHTICGVSLPNSEDFLGKDDTMITVALGNVSHLVYMMAKFMELPLRYPIRPMGSRSSVMDLVTDKLTDKQREFPLYMKGKEKFHFHYGVFLLNKNIAQLRYSNGLGTADLRNTLINLKQLLEAKYGVRIVVKGQSSSYNKAALMAGRTVSLPNASSPIDHARITFDIPGDVTADMIEKERTKSDTNTGSTSGLPSVHIKSHHQHRFIIRNSNNRKSKKTNSLIDVDDGVVSPNLIEVPFEDVVRRTIEGEFTHGQLVENGDNQLAGCCNDNNRTDSRGCCLNDDTTCKNQYSPEDGVADGNSLQSFHRQISDVLIIPDSYEQEKDLSLSPSETVIV